MGFPRPGAQILKETDAQPSPRHERRSHHASGLTDCMRKMYYEWSGAPVTNPPTQQQLENFAAGHEAERQFIQRLEQSHSCQVLAVQLPIEMIEPSLQWPIHGYIDAHIYKKGKTYNIEYKSTKYPGTNNVAEEPYINHVLQAWVYLKAHPADYTHLLYQDRANKLLRTEYAVIEVDGELYYARVPEDGRKFRPSEGWIKVPIKWQDIVKKLRYVERAVGAEEPPPREDLLTGEKFIAYLSNNGDRVVSSKTFYKINGEWVTPKPPGRLVVEDEEVRRTHWKCLGYCEYARLCWVGKEDE